MNITTFLRDCTIDEVTKRQKILWLSTNHTLEDALQIFDLNAILSAPVIDEVGQKILGVLDMFDIVIFILRAIGLSPEMDFDAIPVGYLESLEVDGRLISKALVGNVLGNAASFRAQPATAVVEPSRPLQSVLELFISGVDRVLIAEGGQVHSLYSQSDMVSLIAQSMHLIGLKRRRTIGDLNLAKGPLLAMSQMSRVLSVLKEMCAQQVPAVAVVLESGRIVANFSASNLKGLTSDEFSSLHMSVSDFLHQQKFKDRPLLTSLVHQKSLHPATISSSDTLEYALLKIAASRVHRLWVVDDNFKPIGMLSIADLLRVVICADMELI